MSISTADIKLLRESTGAGVLDCKKALEETNGDIDQAIELLRKKGLAAASKKTSREANDGLVEAQTNTERNLGVMIEVNCETDFVARTDEFQAFVDSLVRQLFEQPQHDTPDSLLNSPYIEDTSRTVQEVLTETIATLGENIVIRNLIRFDLEDGGMIDSYVHPGGRVGVLIEVAGGSPSNVRFAEVVHDLALQIAAASPQAVSQNEVSPAAVEAEKNIYRAQLAEEKKPDNIKERIIEGKLKKWYGEVVLLNQTFIKDSDLTVDQLLKQVSKELDTPINVRRFARFELGTA